MGSRERLSPTERDWRPRHTPADSLLRSTSEQTPTAVRETVLRALPQSAGEVSSLAPLALKLVDTRAGVRASGSCVSGVRAAVDAGRVVRGAGAPEGGRDAGHLSCEREEVRAVEQAES